VARLAREAIAHTCLVTALVLGWVAASGKGCRKTGFGPTCPPRRARSRQSLPEAATVRGCLRARTVICRAGGDPFERASGRRTVMRRYLCSPRGHLDGGIPGPRPRPDLTRSIWRRSVRRLGHPRRPYLA
jgi:hypothetical protein